MRVLFLDIDGVVNCAETFQRHRGFIGIDPYLALLVRRIVDATGCQVVLSSSWRHFPDGRGEVERQVCPIFDLTPTSATGFRGDEIRAWLNGHPEVTRYAIVDDNSDMLPEQHPNFFQTSWDRGITEDISQAIILHLNDTTYEPAHHHPHNHSGPTETAVLSGLSSGSREEVSRNLRALQV